MGGGGSTVGFGRDGTPLSTTNPSFGNGGSKPQFYGDFKPRAPSGSATGNMKFSVPINKYGSAIFRTAKKFGPLAIPFAIMDFLQELGMSARPDGQGGSEVGYVTGGEGMEWQDIHGVWHASLQAAAEASMGKKGAYANCTGFSLYPAQVLSTTAPATFTHNWSYCNNSTQNFGGPATVTVQTRTVELPEEFEPVNEEAFENIVDNLPSPPAAAPGAVEEAVKAGNFPKETGEPKAECTPQNIGAGTRTEVASDGTTKTFQQYWRLSCDGATWRWEEEVRATTSTPGGSTTTSTSTQTEVDPSKIERCRGADKNTIGCMEVDTPTGDIPKSVAEVTFSAETVSLPGGACPAPFSWQDSLGSHSINLSSYCDVVVNVVKPILLAFAALAALMIAAGGIRSD